MGSASDWKHEAGCPAVEGFRCSYDARVISAHRSPDLLFDYIKKVSAQGARCFTPAPAVRRTWPV